MAKRLTEQPFELIDRDASVSLRFEGRDHGGFVGDSISSALLGCGVRLLGRSFKYHRPRGVYSLAGHDANVMLDNGEQTNIRGDITPLRDGQDLRAVNTLGGLAQDYMHLTEWFARFMPVGFYYKTFHTPRKLFPFYEKQLRQAAGLGKVNPDSRPITTPKRYDFADVLIVGSGPAGLSAALQAAEHQLKVVVVDDQPYIGGSLAYQWAGDDNARTVLRDLIHRCQVHERIDLRPATQAAGYYADHWVGLVDAGKLTKLRAQAVIVATGAIEQPAVFRNNDLPGVMLAGAAQRLMRLYAVKPCERCVVLTANSEGYLAALDMLEAGIDVAAVADLRPGGESSELAQRLTDAGVAIHRGHGVHEATTTDPARGVMGAVLCPINDHGELDTHHSVRINCDGLLVSVGYAPNGGLLYQAGTRFGYADHVEQFVPQQLPEGVFAAGRVNGVFDLQDQLADGRRASLFAAAHIGRFDGHIPEPIKHRGAPPTHPYPIFAHPKGKNFVDFDEDLHLKDFVNAVQEGYDNIELIKRYTTVGMGPSQGKLSNMNAVRILAKLTGRSIDETGSTTSRPFYQPVSMNILAGRRFHAHRHTPMHQWHAHHGAAFILAGAWLRPEYYHRMGVPREQAIFNEANNVRQNVGLIDVSTLGKIELGGPDAAAMLERTYTGRFDNLAVGRMRYCLALDESGVIIDDGIVVRSSDNRFYVTATTSGVDAMAREMMRNAKRWGLNVSLVNATGRFAAMNIAGPRSRDVLQSLTDTDLSADAFGYMHARQATVAGAPAKLMRVGFVGELGYEVHVPARYGMHVWASLMQAGTGEGIMPFGVEAQRLLRLEKAHVIISQDTDALTSPYDARMDWALAMDKDYFVGQRSLRIIEKQTPQRKLVGFAFDRGYSGPLPEEYHLVIDSGRITGRVTSIAKQSTQGYALGMAYVAPQQTKPGTKIAMRVGGGQMIEATIIELPFYDPKQERQKV
jgi:sarcosine oxidase subunit alpha